MKKTTIPSIETLTKSGYYHVNSSITNANFLVPETVETEGYKIIPLEKYASSEECLEIIKKAGCRPANIHELALLKNNHPEAFIKGKYHVTFGSTWKDADGYLRVPSVLADDGGDFWFNLDAFDGGWSADYCLVCFCDNQRSGGKLGVRISKLDLDDEWDAGHGVLFSNEIQILKADESLALGNFDTLSPQEQVYIQELKKKGFKITRVESKEVEY